MLQSHYELTGSLQPQFAPGSIPGQSPPTGMAVVTEVTSKIPWNGGYQIQTHSSNLGKGMNTTFSEFQ